jgi:hypothetical protein
MFRGDCRQIGSNPATCKGKNSLAQGRVWRTFRKANFSGSMEDHFRFAVIQE